MEVIIEDNIKRDWNFNLSEYSLLVYAENQNILGSEIVETQKDITMIAILDVIISNYIHIVLGLKSFATLHKWRSEVNSDFYVLLTTVWCFYLIVF